MNTTPIRRARGAFFSQAATRWARLAAAFCAGSSCLAGCTTHNCDPSTVSVTPVNPDGAVNAAVPYGNGQVLWRSSPDNGPWLDFAGMRTFVVTYPQPIAEAQPDCYVSADPNDPQASFTRCGGATAIFSDASAAGVTVLNPSCGEFGLQVFVIGVPLDTDAGPDSAGAPASDASDRE